MENIGILVSRLNRTGPINVIYNIVSNLHTKFRFYIITIKDELKNDSRVSEFKILNIYLHQLKSKTFIGKCYELKKYINTNSIKIIHAHTLSAITIASFMSAKKICTIHSDYYNEFWENSNIKYKGYWKLLCNRIKKYDEVICCANFFSKSLIGYNKNISAIQNGVYLPNYTKKEIQGKVIYLYCGSLDKRKNVLTLAVEFEQHCKKNEILIMAGRGELMESIKQLSLNHVKLLGFKDNLKDLYTQSHYFVSCSSSEGLPLAVLEAMSYGLPVLLSDIPSHREIFQRNSNIGVIINESFGEAIEILRKADYQKLSENAYMTIYEYFSNEIMSKNYSIHYNKLLFE